MEANVERAGKYYTCMGEKDIEGVKRYLAANVQFYSPLTSMQGKEAVAEATAKFMEVFTSLKIRAQFGSGELAMVVYEVDIPGISTHFPSASLLTFCKGQITQIELFFDGRPFSR